ncbi:N-ATPase subunit AtpR [Amaricoccus solimangrovi]|uniref:ATP synthase subunit I n=1 Tax=Amaricoccus solimangrovi TaxID=2589815 RepID=A0A501WWS6_9RHOB|nr:ATP synthase subunit I [Amaricoccus solimangrovi]TPE53918.1 hypothetical protein FJM51_02405 [Amaricoccus solimangrovi]
MSGSAFLLAPLAALTGYAAGWLHFASLRRVARMITEGRLAAVGLQIGRLALLGLLLWVFARAGAAVLLAGAAGILVARARVTRGAR